MDAPARTRRKGREWALQMIVQADLNPFADVNLILAHFWEQQWSCRQEAKGKEDNDMDAIEALLPPEERLATAELKAFTEDLVRGTLGHLGEIDATLSALCENWELDRLGVIERCVLRLACFEMDWFGTPAPVAINEAVDLAKRFANEESGAFVNGVLDRHARGRRA